MHIFHVNHREANLNHPTRALLYHYSTDYALRSISQPLKTNMFEILLIL